MKLRLKKSTALISSSLTMLGLFAVVGIAAQNFSGRTVEAQAGEGVRLVTVHDRGLQSTFVTEKETLREAFADAKIEINAQDAVEPGLDEKLVAPDYQVNVYRARPITVVDGATRQKIITPYQSAKRIVEGANITLHAEDTTTLTRSANIVGDGAGLQLVIDRATLISVDLFGKVTEVRTQANTIGAFLKEKDIELTKDDRVSVSNDTAITAGMTFRIWREGTQTITVEEAVAFETEQIKDADREVGYKAVQSAGTAGKRTVTYDVEIQNGQEVARQEIASVTTLEPVKQVEIVGSKAKSLLYTGGGSQSEWLGASAIPQKDWGNAQWLVQKESGWNPNAVNRSSGACGLAQALPCSKVPGNPHDPVNSLNWMQSYVLGRYGSWEAAVSHSKAKGWY